MRSSGCVLFFLFYVVAVPQAYADYTLGKVLDFITGSSDAIVASQPGVYAFPGEPGPDRMTENCLYCHDGSITSKVSTHPVGIYYEDYVRRHPGDYRSVDYRGPGGIPLVNGKVSCISCHRLKQDLAQSAAADSVLVAEQDVCSASKQLNSGVGERGLCVACHIK